MLGAPPNFAIASLAAQPQASPTAFDILKPMTP